MSGFWYLATPYRKFPGGLDAAAEEAARIAAVLTDAGIAVFAPIPHGHAIAKHSIIPKDSPIWADMQRPFMLKAGGLIVAKMEGCDRSAGIRVEIDHFKRSFKPRIDIEPDEIELMIPILKATHLS